MTKATLLSDIEDHKGDHTPAYLRTIERRYGIAIKIFKPRKNVHSKVYGSSSGEKYEYSDEIQGLVTGDDFFPSDMRSSGSFQEGFLYTSYHDKIDPLDQISFKAVGEKRDNSNEGRSRQYKVVDKEAIGQTTEVMYRFRISALGD